MRRNPPAAASAANAAAAAGSKSTTTRPGIDFVEASRTILPSRSSCCQLGAAALTISLPSPAEPGAASSTHAGNYASLVCWDYSQLPKLQAWKETERILTTTLTEAYPSLHKLSREENGSPGQLKDFLRKLPDAPEQFTIVYLAAHQSPGGQWYFPDRSVADWGSLMADLPTLKNPHRIVLLDCCFAQAASRWADWPEKIAPACIFASPADRPTPDLFVFHRRPVDWARVVFPGHSRWLRQHRVTDSDERISFFGVAWLEAWTKQSSPPRTMADWNELGQTMTQIARQASTQIHAKFVSTISSSFPPNH